MMQKVVGMFEQPEAAFLGLSLIVSVVMLVMISLSEWSMMPEMMLTVLYLLANVGWIMAIIRLWDRIGEGWAMLVAVVLVHVSILLLWFVGEAALEVLRGVFG